jgi:hypothetical protein
MGEIQKYKDLIGRRVADDELEELAVDLLKAAVTNKGNWTGLWDGVLARVLELPPEARSRIADGLVTQYHSEQAGPNARENALIVLGIVSRDLPPHDRLAAERRSLLDGISRQHSFWYGARYENLIEAELAAGRPIAPAVVATVRRAVLHAYRNEDLPRTAKKLTDPPLNVGEEWAEQALRDAETDAGPAWKELLAHTATATAAKPSAKWDKQAAALTGSLGPDRVREEIEELAVPAYGLTGVGHAEHRLGEATAVLGVQGTKAVLTWHNASGNPVRTVPAAVRRDHPEELKELKAAVKDIDRMLSAQSERLDRQFLADRTWSHATWRERYLDHQLVGALARRLLWTVDGTTVGYAEGALRTVTDTPVTEGAEVRLWHPVDHTPAEIVAWRDWLERHRITQPFKQAHREVYLLTDAERATGTYSNRFAAHVLRQHQFHSLAAARGWRNKLRLAVDDEAPPATRDLPRWGLRAEYWIEGDGGADYTDLTDSGTFLRLRTDQVRFYPIDAPENSAHCCGGEYRMWLRNGADPVDPLPLTDIPPLVLSEVLRDVDLFVGVASVGNDPTWQDGGPGGRFREYWTSYGFGELNQSAETRRLLLDRLIPRLAIADRCTLEGRFLHVKGDRHTYKIHLGSGNILRTPNDQYLCIVPKSDPSAAQAGYLPYEGDRMLAVILSKAMMLADDTRITDPTILSQL